jgi:hypothetical protein
MSGFIEWDAIANIIVVGLLFGAGLPALFALGVRALAGPGALRADGQVRLLRRMAAYACFAVIVLSVTGAIFYIASGGH